MVPSSYRHRKLSRFRSPYAPSLSLPLCSLSRARSGLQASLRFHTLPVLPLRSLRTFKTAQVQELTSNSNTLRFFLSLRSSPRPISIVKLHTLPRFHRRPIYLIVSEGSYLLIVVAVFFFRGASRLDAFSVYPVRTSLPSCAFGKTTVAPEVRPSRSSRTRDSSRHDSCAHDG